ncbi:hypothetical protein A9Q84_05165 [Halobacteriovorax marinus]|uniref:Bacterial sugar transferase domain-containing protein n=1 Tax=Halobacteriovorax marinus TaxID=97084 RepID=A0A1Y5FHK3_9BACT|nr:hypothetical protein A9Q84_05165 [Halobacteriovorax marinus]
MLKRIFDITFVIILLIPCSFFFLLVSLFIFMVSRGSVIHWSKRVGQKNVIFLMPKFRTMKIDTPQVATHLIKASDYLILGGGLIRKLSLDEIPQLWSILTGKMSFVGPRPALFNQDDLIEQRTNIGVDQLVPGLTGWAQINGRDELSIQEKVKLDHEYLLNRSFLFDLKILFLTFEKVISQKSVSH